MTQQLYALGFELNHRKYTVQTQQLGTIEFKAILREHTESIRRLNKNTICVAEGIAQDKLDEFKHTHSEDLAYCTELGAFQPEDLLKKLKLIKA